MKFKRITDEVFRVGITDFYVLKAGEQYWASYILRDGFLHPLIFENKATAFYTRKTAAEFCLKKPWGVNPDRPSVPLPERERSEQPARLMRFVSELKKL